MHRLWPIGKLRGPQWPRRGNTVSRPLRPAPRLQALAMAGFADLLFTVLLTESQWRVDALLGT